MNKEFDVVVELDADGYYVASVPALLGCHTQARYLDKLMARFQVAIVLCLEVEGLLSAPTIHFVVICTSSVIANYFLHCIQSG
jgi:predicted RNase H-like HicB family nuclease